MGFFQDLVKDLGESAAVLIPIVAIIVGLFLAWIVGRFGAFLVRRLLNSTKIDERASESLGTKTQIVKWVSGFTFWALFIFVLAWLINLATGFVPGLQGNVVQSPLDALLAEWVGKLIGVGVSLLVAWIIASVLRFLVVRILNATKLDEWLGEKVTNKKTSNMNDLIGKTVFWLVFLVFIPSILNNLGVGQAAELVQGLVNNIFSYIPGVIGAVIVLILGGLFARILRQIVTGFLEGVGVDSLGERIGFSKSKEAQPLSALLGTVVYVLIFIPIVVQALQLLNLPVITEIGARLLDGATTMILNALGAVVILFVAYYLAKFISDIVASLLAGIGIDRLPEALGFKTAKGATLSSVIGTVVLVAVMLLAVQGTAQSIGLTDIAALVGSLIAFAGSVLLGIVIFIAGIYLANVASNVIMTAGGNDAAFLANIARWAILIFVGFIALSQAGIDLAGEVLQIILLAVGAAFALAFGLGGRDTAAKQVEKWFNRKK